MLPIPNVTAKVLARTQAHAKNQRDRNPTEWTQTNRAHRLSLAVRIEQPVGDVEVRITVPLLLHSALVTLYRALDELHVQVGILFRV